MKDYSVGYVPNVSERIESTPVSPGAGSMSDLFTKQIKLNWDTGGSNSIQFNGLRTGEKVFGLEINIHNLTGIDITYYAQGLSLPDRIQEFYTNWELLAGIITTVKGGAAILPDDTEFIRLIRLNENMVKESGRFRFDLNVLYTYIDRTELSPGTVVTFDPITI